jgi:hypothetical protein
VQPDHIELNVAAPGNIPKNGAPTQPNKSASRSDIYINTSTPEDIPGTGNPTAQTSRANQATQISTPAPQETFPAAPTRPTEQVDRIQVAYIELNVAAPGSIPKNGAPARPNKSASRSDIYINTSTPGRIPRSCTEPDRASRIRLDGADFNVEAARSIP